jgi:hypothetical protein
MKLRNVPAFFGEDSLMGIYAIGDVHMRCPLAIFPVHVTVLENIVPQHLSMVIIAAVPASSTVLRYMNLQTYYCSKNRLPNFNIAAHIHYSSSIFISLY